MKLELFYPIKPYVVNQPWGVHRPDVYGQFGFTDHNGIDLGIVGSDMKVRAPMNGTVAVQGYQPHGAGYFLTMISDDEFDWDDGKRTKVELGFYHLERYNCVVGQKVTVGDLLAIPDNTGFSTGPHTHMAAKRVSGTPSGYVLVDSNTANNTFNQEPYFNGKYAVDEARIKILKQLISLYQQVISMLKK